MSINEDRLSHLEEIFFLRCVQIKVYTLTDIEKQKRRLKYFEFDLF